MQTEFNTQIVDRIVIWIVDTTWTVDIPTTDTPWDLDIAGTIWIKIPQTSSIAPIADIPRGLEIACAIKVVCTGGITLTADTPKAPLVQELAPYNDTLVWFYVAIISSSVNLRERSWCLHSTASRP